MIEQGIRKTNNKKRWLKMFFGFLITTIFVYLIYKHIDIQEIAKAFKKLSIIHIILAISLLAIGYFFRIIRWWMMFGMSKYRPSLHQCTGPFLISIAINNIIPMRAGDIYRVFSLNKTHSIAPGTVLGTLTLERLLDLLALLMVFFVTVPSLFEGEPYKSVMDLVKFLVVICGIALVMLITLHGFATKFLIRIEQYPRIQNHSFLAKCVRQFKEFFETIGHLCSFYRLLALMLLSISIWIFEGSVFWSVSWSITHKVSILAPYFSLSTGTLATLLPSSPGYVGTFDYFAMQGLHAYGTDITVAAAFALIVHLLLWLPTTLAGFTYFLIRQTYSMPHQNGSEITK